MTTIEQAQDILDNLDNPQVRKLAADFIKLTAAYNEEKARLEGWRWLSSKRRWSWREPMNGHGWRILDEDGIHVSEGATQEQAIDAARKQAEGA